MDGSRSYVVFCIISLSNIDMTIFCQCISVSNMQDHILGIVLWIPLKMCYSLLAQAC